jgi:hypothetical protein
MTLANLADTIPVLGPLFADAQFRWWLLGIYLAIGPVPEDIPSKSPDPREPPITKWRWGGLLRVLMLGAVGHSRLADRIGQLESAVDSVGTGMAIVVTELRALRGALGRAGIIGLAPEAEDQNVGPVSSIGPVSAVACGDVVPQIRRSVPSRPQL